MPLIPRESQQAQVALAASSVDPNLLLFGFGVLALIGFLGFLIVWRRND